MRIPTMTLRDYFAAHALIGLIGQGATLQVHHPEGVLTLPMSEGAPVIAYRYADAMMAAREPKND